MLGYLPQLSDQAGRAKAVPCFQLLVMQHLTSAHTSSQALGLAVMGGCGVVGIRTCSVRKGFCDRRNLHKLKQMPQYSEEFSVVLNYHRFGPRRVT